MGLSSRRLGFCCTINAGVRDGLHHVKRFSCSHMNFNLGEMSFVGPRDVPRRHKFKYDLLYLKKQSFWLDLRLIA
jgi:hypothetical protein